VYVPSLIVLRQKKDFLRSKKRGQLFHISNCGLGEILVWMTVMKIILGADKFHRHSFDMPASFVCIACTWQKSSVQSTPTDFKSIVFQWGFKSFNVIILRYLSSLLLSSAADPYIARLTIVSNKKGCWASSLGLPCSPRSRSFSFNPGFSEIADLREMWNEMALNLLFLCLI